MSSPVQIPANGEKITVNGDFSLNVPDQPIIPFIEGDGTGVDITPVMKRVLRGASRTTSRSQRPTAISRCTPP